MSDKDKRRARGALVMRELRQRRAARKAMGRAVKVEGDAFEKVKVKMVMRIYGVSVEEAKKIIAKRAAEVSALEAENRTTTQKRARTYRRVYSSSGEWIPASEIFGDAEE